MAWSDMADRVLQKTINVFQTSATYTPVVGSAYPLKGVFSKPFQSVDLQTGVPVNSIHPTFGVRLADMSAPPAEGDILTIGTTIYQVFDPQGDGEGGSTLTLHKVG